MSINRALDEILVMQCQSGDSRAFQLLVQRWHNRILTYSAKLTKDQEAANDITQECWQSVIKGLKKLRDPAHFATWIYRIAHNKSVDWIRKNQRTRVLKEEIKQQKVGIDDSTTESSNKLKLIEQAMILLPENQQLVLNLFYKENLSIKQIGEVLGLSIGTVKSRLFHAREHLKKAIKSRNHEKI